MKTSRGHRTVSATVRIVVLFIFAVFLLFPFYWMVVTSLKTDPELYNLSYNPLLIKLGITLKHYAYLFQQTLFVRWFANTMIITICVTAITLVFSLLAGYSMARLRYHGRTAFALGVFAAYLVPPTLLFIPLYSVVKLSGSMDTIWSLVLTYPTFTIPFCTWLVMGYLKTIPRELEESAMIDGASRLQSLVRIVVPLALPGLTTAGLFSFTLSWSQFLYGVAFVSPSPDKPLAVGVVTELVRGDVFYWGSLMGGALLTSVPVVVIYAFFARYFIAGLTAGATKF